MDFTREPLIETVIASKEGFKLIIRSTNGDSQREYSVGAVEVVSFGNCYFFRCLEKPKAFLLSMTEYEVIETREIRTVLKKPLIEKSIKIGGGKKVESSKDEDIPKEEKKKRERKHSRKRRVKEGQEENFKEEKKNSREEKSPEASPKRTLLPPPTSLISEQIDRYKDYLVEQGALLPEEIEEPDEKIEKISREEKNTSSCKKTSSEEKVVDLISKETPVLSEDEES